MPLARPRRMFAIATLVAALLSLGAVAAPALAARPSGKNAARPHRKSLAPRPHTETLWVYWRGAKNATCTKTDPCRTISRAVRKARPGSRVIIEHGAYLEQVTLTKRLNLIGLDHAGINADGGANGVRIVGPGASGSLVRGLDIRSATFEGILVQHASHVRIVGNSVVGNDIGIYPGKPGHGKGECAPQGEVPGDCGEAIHLLSSSGSTVMRNLVYGNGGGILLTDEAGPAAHNVIARNRILYNLSDCGITLAAHSPMAVAEDGARQPSEAGVRDNLILGNVVKSNGLGNVKMGGEGEGAGILIAAALPGAGAYDNVVVGNVAEGNGLPGITLHSHTPGQDLNGNVIVANTVGRNGLKGDPDAGVTQTAGILVFSAVTHLEGTLIRYNRIRNVHFGIWTHNVPPIEPGSNYFGEEVAVRVAQD